MDKKYISTIICNGKHYVIVEMKNAAHVMSVDECKEYMGNCILKCGKMVRKLEDIENWHRQKRIISSYEVGEK